MHQDDLNNWLNRRMDTQRNGCFEKIDDHLVHTIPNRHPRKKDVLPKMFFKSSRRLISSAAFKYSTVCTSPIQQQRNLPSLLYVSSSMLQLLLQYMRLTSKRRSRPNSSPGHKISAPPLQQETIKV